MEAYAIWLLLIGLAFIGAAWVPYLLHHKPLSFPMVYVAVGAAVFSLPLGIEVPSPLRYAHATERFTELIVIIALMGAGLKLDRRVGWRRWASTWRLLGPTMLLCIAVFAWAGWALLGLDPASAVLLGAVLAPTDPVLAAQVQVPPPMERETEPQFALTSEAGLNDGLAFPFTNMAVAMAAFGAAPANWIGEWLLMDLLYKVLIGTVVGVALGYATGYFIYEFPSRKRFAETGEGFVALGLTLLSYAATELANGYGFLAVFVTAVTLRHYERTHEYNRTLHRFADDLERLLIAVILILFGGVLAGGLLRGLTWAAVLTGLGFILLVRPAVGLLSLAGTGIPLKEKATIAFFGIRGIGSIYYLAFALNHADFAQREYLWAIVSFIILASIVIHGALASPVMEKVEEEA